MRKQKRDGNALKGNRKHSKEQNRRWKSAEKEMENSLQGERKQTKSRKGGSPGLVVMGGDSCSIGCEFKSQHHILDGIFSTFICCNICNVCLKRQKETKKKPRMVQFQKSRKRERNRAKPQNVDT